MAKKERPIDSIEQSITVKYRSKIFSKFVGAIYNYNLIKPGDKICVCISGGKDSMLMARLFMQLQKLEAFQNFEVKYLVMNPGYNEANFNLIKENVNKLNIPAIFEETDIFEIASMQDRSPCFLCAKMRRGALYNLARKHGCNKIALGHHYDDVIETTLMNMLNSGSFQTMLPKLKSTNYDGMELIRPMYYVREQDIISWCNYVDIHFIRCACKFTETASHETEGLTSSQRANTKTLIKELKKNYNEDVEKNIFNAANNVTLDMILGYKLNSEYHSYLDDYDDNKQLLKVKITVMKMECHQELIDKYENPIEHACDMVLGKEFISINANKPEGFCESAWTSVYPFVKALANGEEDFYDGWMKNKRSAMISCNDGFRPVSFYLEVID